MKDKEKIGFDLVDNKPDYSKSKEENIEIDKKKNENDKDTELNNGK